MSWIAFPDWASPHLPMKHLNSTSYSQDNSNSSVEVWNYKMLCSNVNKQSWKTDQHHLSPDSLNPLALGATTRSQESKSRLSVAENYLPWSTAHDYKPMPNIAAVVEQALLRALLLSCYLHLHRMVCRKTEYSNITSATNRKMRELCSATEEWIAEVSKQSAN